MMNIMETFTENHTSYYGLGLEDDAPVVVIVKISEYHPIRAYLRSDLEVLSSGNIILFFIVTMNRWRNYLWNCKQQLQLY